MLCYTVSGGCCLLNTNTMWLNIDLHSLSATLTSSVYSELHCKQSSVVQLQVGMAFRLLDG
jgi:hypothetical protein